MTKSRSRHYTSALALISLVAVCLGLSGCTPADRIAARLIDSRLTFVACDDPVAQRVSVFVVAPGPDDPNPPTYWQLDGDGRIWHDTPIEYGVLPAGFDETVAPMTLPTDDSSIAIFLDKLDNDGQLVRRVGGNFVASALSDKYWLQTGGGKTAEPCS